MLLLKLLILPRDVWEKNADLVALQAVKMEIICRICVPLNCAILLCFYANKDSHRFSCSEEVISTYFEDDTRFPVHTSDAVQSATAREATTAVSGILRIIDGSRLRYIPHQLIASRLDTGASSLHACLLGRDGICLPRWREVSCVDCLSAA